MSDSIIMVLGLKAILCCLALHLLLQLSTPLRLQVANWMLPKCINNKQFMHHT